MKYIILFSPSPHSFYRVKEIVEPEDANTFRQWADEMPHVYIHLMTYEVIERRGSPIALLANGNKEKYMVLWVDMSPCYHIVREFDVLEEAIAFASKKTIELQTPDEFEHGVAGSLRLLNFKTIREWNVWAKPDGKGLWQPPDTPVLLVQ